MSFFSSRPSGNDTWEMDCSLCGSEFLQTVQVFISNITRKPQLSFILSSSRDGSSNKSRGSNPLSILWLFSSLVELPLDGLSFDEISEVLAGDPASQ